MMKLGKFFITQELANDKEKLAALTQFISIEVIILEKIVAVIDDKQVVWMLGICDKFDDCPDRIIKIPEYEFTFKTSMLLGNAGELICEVSAK